jgi:hypothetical protein
MEYKVVQLTPQEFKARSENITTLLQEVVDFMHHDARERVCNRSHGETMVTFTWEDGFLRLVKVQGGHVLKPGKSGNLPGISPESSKSASKDH